MALTARSCAPPPPPPPRVQGVPQGPGRGIIPRAIEDVFAAIQAGDVGAERARFLVRASYLQIYNEVRGQSAGVHRSGADGALRALRCNTPPTPLRCAQTISDLLKPEGGPPLVVREDRQRGVRVEGLSEWVVRSPAEVYHLMQVGGRSTWGGARLGSTRHACRRSTTPSSSRSSCGPRAAPPHTLTPQCGAAVRTTGATKLNEISSRSHAIFQLIVEKSTAAPAAAAGYAAAALVASGGSGIFDSRELQRVWRDINAAAAHNSFVRERAGGMYGRAILGLPPSKFDRIGQ